MANTAAERGVLTVRLPADLHEQLRAYKYFTGRSINDLAVDLIRDYLAGPGRSEINRGMTERTKAMYGDALTKLAEL
jgi:hypothetical protein